MTEMTALRAPVPSPAAGDVLVAVHAAAITGRRPGKTVIVVRD